MKITSEWAIYQLAFLASHLKKIVDKLPTLAKKGEMFNFYRLRHQNEIEQFMNR